MYFPESDTRFAPTSGPLCPGDLLREPYTFTCLTCGISWEAEYEVICRMGNLGVDREIYTVDGEVTPPPTAPRTCAGCGSAQVRGRQTEPTTVAHNVPVPRLRLRLRTRSRR
ncbi:hypothetical protein [Streptomyces sp. NBC_01264]|uniref:hypothetical protein n=1 Tax=Streptomyces sp. NBC_01264 TaxID=2903804 RepID=UPI0022553C9D|nr:hypothetical protein [Streptomyces sp. NBC_01264]MCX4781527.1 hypothetical protein [Streptomyces sp. NBC_01264]